MAIIGPEEVHALLMSTMAGLASTVGAVIAIAKRPDDALLALLLGLAFGVMFLLSVVELWLRAAMENGWLAVSASVAAGAAMYALLAPLLPTFDSDAHQAQQHALQQALKAKSSGLAGAAATGGVAGGGGGGSAPHPSNAVKRHGVSEDGDGEMTHVGEAAVAGGTGGANEEPKYDKMVSLRHGELLRLSFLMAATMTAHNLPEGFAVAFSSYTDFGPVMAAAIAVHNIPEGIIVAAPIYAATGSKWRAVLAATASGLSEPVGALIALVLVKPFVDVADSLHLLLAFVGGVMGAVCILELLPEGRKCKHDTRLVQGIVLGAVAMGWTLYIGV